MSDSDIEQRELLEEILLRDEGNLKASIPYTLYIIEKKFALIGLDYEDIITLIKRHVPWSRKEIRRILDILKKIEAKLMKAEEKRLDRNSRSD